MEVWKIIFLSKWVIVGPMLIFQGVPNIHRKQKSTNSFVQQTTTPRLSGRFFLGFPRPFRLNQVRPRSPQIQAEADFSDCLKLALSFDSNT